MKEFKDAALLGAMEETLAKFPEDTLDFCVSDPPYGISFMGRTDWDYKVPSVQSWKALLRVLKPGAHALIFGGTTTYHRLLVNAEDAGFQVRNTIPWLYGEGFPKNMNIINEIYKWSEYKCKAEKIIVNSVDNLLNQSGRADVMDGKNIVQKNVLVFPSGKENLKIAEVVENHFTLENQVLKERIKNNPFIAILNVRRTINEDLQANLIIIGKEALSRDQTVILRLTLEMENIDLSMISLLKNILEEDSKKMRKFITLTEIDQIIGSRTYSFLQSPNMLNFITNNATALKPACELVALVRKPISEKTIAANVIRWGTGALNIEGSRIAHRDNVNMEMKQRTTNLSKEKFFDKDTRQMKEPIQTYKETGRWPSNVIFDEFAAAELDRQSGHSRSGNQNAIVKNPGSKIEMNSSSEINVTGHNDSGGASRFFKVIDPSDGLFIYQSKASKSEKNAGCENLELKTTTDGRKKDIDNAYLRGTTKRNNFHATVKPLGLIKYLANLISFPGAWGIDPYAGSGTFAIACRELFLHWTCIERDPDYYKIIEARLRQGYLIDTLIDQ